MRREEAGGVEGTIRLLPKQKYMEGFKGGGGRKKAGGNGVPKKHTIWWHLNQNKHGRK